MSTVQLKEELHQHIDKADDRLLHIMLAMLEGD